MAKEFAPHLPPLAFESEVGDAKLQTILVPMRHTGVLPCDPHAVNGSARAPSPEESLTQSRGKPRFSKTQARVTATVS